MNITFLIGNGFDINLGLATRYSDFLKEYLKENLKDDKDIKRFKADIVKRNLEDEKNGVPIKLWSNAELALGEYTAVIDAEAGGASLFCKLHHDFCRRLAEYLQEQEAKVDTQGFEQLFINAIQNFRVGLSEVQRAQVEKSYNSTHGAVVFNFVVFNYTEIVDRIVQAIKNGTFKFGQRYVTSSNVANSIGTTIHVHGTTTKDMILGVNDPSQIKNMEIFEKASSAYLSAIIKQRTNQRNEARIDEKTSEIIRNSSFIYIYGMSLGDTDAIWWERIVQRMKAESHVHVFIYGYDAPKDTLLQTERWIYDDEQKSRLLSFSKEDTTGLEKRIHIIDADIFAALRGRVKTNTETEVDNIPKDTEQLTAS